MLNYIDNLEVRFRRQSAGITLLMTAVLVVCLSFWMMPKISDPPLLQEEKEEIFEVVGGGMDYGSYTNGSGDVNNFRDPSETPRDAPPKAAPAETKTPPIPAAPKITTTVREQIVSSNEPAEVTAPSPSPKSPSKPDPQPQPVEQVPVKREVKVIKRPKIRTNTTSSSLFSSGGGSNHGNGTGIGNRGTPESAILNKNGLYSFGTGSGNGSGGEGEGGLNGRRLLYQVAPKYDSQEEGRIRFKITVSPGGEVVAVKAVNYSGQLKLKRAVEECLRKWKFSPKGGSENQVIVVNYTFRLR